MQKENAGSMPIAQLRHHLHQEQLYKGVSEGHQRLQLWHQKLQKQHVKDSFPRPEHFDFEYWSQHKSLNELEASRKSQAIDPKANAWLESWPFLQTCAYPQSTPTNTASILPHQKLRGKNQCVLMPNPIA